MASNRTKPPGYVPGLLPGMLLLAAGGVWIVLLSGLNAIVLAMVVRQFWGADQISAAKGWLAPLAFVLALVEVGGYAAVQRAILRRRQRASSGREPDYGGWRQLWEGPISEPRADGKLAEPAPHRLDIWDGVESSAS